MISTHWKLAFRAVRKAFGVTFQTAYAAVRAQFYSRKVEFDLADQRKLFATLETNSKEQRTKNKEQRTKSKE